MGSSCGIISLGGLVCNVNTLSSYPYTETFPMSRAGLPGPLWKWGTVNPAVTDRRSAANPFTVAHAECIHKGRLGQFYTRAPFAPWEMPIEQAEAGV